MSALPVTTEAAAPSPVPSATPMIAAAGASAVTPLRDVGTGTSAGTRPPLRIVTTPAPAPTAHPLAPTSRAQAWRRRVAVATVLCLLAALAAVMLAGAIGGAVTVTPPAAPVPVADGFVVVEPGDTVWDIAGRLAPEGVSTATYAGRIVERNGLIGGAVEEWQVLRLP